MHKAIVEMPKGTRFKYEISKSDGHLILDRPINDSVPENYGFIPNTMADDGDPLDVFIAAMEPIPSLTEVSIEVVGIIKGVDAGKQDDKVLAYVKGDDLGQRLITQMEFIGMVKIYLQNYKEGFIIQDVLGKDEAAAEIARCAV